MEKSEIEYRIHKESSSMYYEHLLPQRHRTTSSGSMALVPRIFFEGALRPDKVCVAMNSRENMDSNIRLTMFLRPFPSLDIRPSAIAFRKSAS
jgi:hypothetical protein